MVSGVNCDSCVYCFVEIQDGCHESDWRSRLVGLGVYLNQRTQLMERNIKPEDFAALAQDAQVLDVRRKAVYEVSNEIIQGPIWKDPEQVDQWIA